MNKPINEPKKDTIWDIMRNRSVVFSMSLRDGFANIEMDKDYQDREKMVVKFFDEEGVSQEDMAVSVDDVASIAKFVEELKALKIEEYKKQ